jgi:hypothetical protein
MHWTDEMFHVASEMALVNGSNGPGVIKRRRATWQVRARGGKDEQTRRLGPQDR